MKAAGHNDENGLPEMLGDYYVSEISASKYKEIRDRYFENEGYVRWDEKALEYAVAENDFCGGKTLLLTKKLSDNNLKEAVMMYRIENDDNDRRLRVIETTLEDKELSNVLNELMFILNIEQAFAHNCGGMILLPKAYEQWKGKDGYLGLTLG
jgi:hypothetical protein